MPSGSSSQMWPCCLGWQRSMPTLCGQMLRSENGRGSCCWEWEPAKQRTSCLLAVCVGCGRLAWDGETPSRGVRQACVARRCRERGVQGQGQSPQAGSLFLWPYPCCGAQPPVGRYQGQTFIPLPGEVPSHGQTPERGRWSRPESSGLEKEMRLRTLTLMMCSLILQLISAHMLHACCMSF